MSVSLHPITKHNLDACLSLTVAPDQRELVATNVRSIAQAYADPRLVPLAIYPEDARGWESPELPMLGFTMYEVGEEVGFIVRLMIDVTQQRRGYGRAAMREVIRRLRRTPQVRLIGTSYVPTNVAAAALYRGLGFVPWELPFSAGDDEVYLRFDPDRAGDLGALPPPE